MIGQDDAGTGGAGQIDGFCHRFTGSRDRVPQIVKCAGIELQGTAKAGIDTAEGIDRQCAATEIETAEKVSGRALKRQRTLASFGIDVGQRASLQQISIHQGFRVALESVGARRGISPLDVAIEGHQPVRAVG